MSIRPLGDGSRSTNTSFLKDTSAVSEALGFMLILGIVISGMSILLSQQVPAWTKEFEAEHADQVPHEFAELDSAIDLAIISGEPAVSTECPIKMSPRAVLPVIPLSTGTLTFDPDAESIELITGTDEGNRSENGSWLSTPISTPTNFSSYDKFQVTIHDYGAELALEIGEDKTIPTGKQYLAGAFRFNHFVVPAGATLYTSDLIIYARTITIESGAEINADGRGNAGGVYDVSGKGPGAGLNYANNDSAGGGGAGHGGAGGTGGSSYYGSGGAGGLTYGSPTDEKTALSGSGGGGGSSSRLTGVTQWLGGDGGNGGGSVLLHAPVINVAGTLTVNGLNGGDASDGDESAGGGGGGGSGGCILLRGDNVTVSGTLSANGGNGGNGGSANYTGGGGGGGAGGIIKIFYGTHFENTGMEGYVKNGAGGVSGEEGTGGTNGNSGANGVFNSGGSWLPYSPEVRYFSKGYLISNVTATHGHIGFNATAKASICYGTMSWNETLPDEDTNITMKVRTSICPDMRDAPPWEDCPEVRNGMDISDISSVSDGHEYIQWRAELTTFDLAKTPILKNVSIDYECCTPTLVNASGALYFKSNYLRFPDFQLIYAHGATIRSQIEGEFMLFPPPLSISKQGNTTAIQFTAVNLAGAKRTFSGALSTTAKATYQDGELLTNGLNFLNITLKIYTEHPEPWRAWFNETCAAAGLTIGTGPGQYNWVGDGYPLQIVFYGNETRPVNVWLRRAEASIELETGLF